MPHGKKSYRSKGKRVLLYSRTYYRLISYIGASVCTSDLVNNLTGPTETVSPCLQTTATTLHTVYEN